MQKYLLPLIILFSLMTALSAKAQYETKPLSWDLKSYILRTYKPVKGKKIVVYPNEKPNCPYGRAFMKALKKQQNNSDLQESYSFQPQAITSKTRYSSQQEALVAFDFLNSCGIVCVINLEDNWIYSIGNAVGAEEAKLLPDMFNSLKSK